MRLQLFLLSLWIGLCSFAQDTSYYSFSTIDQAGNPYPFVHFKTNSNAQHGLTSITGKATIGLKYLPDTLTFYNRSGFPAFEKILTDTTMDSTIVLNRLKNFIPLTETSPEALRIIENVVAYRNRNAPEASAPFYYTTYNKLIVTSTKMQSTVSFFNRILNIFKVKIKDLPTGHHIVLSESTTERRYLSPLNEDESVTASRVSGIEKPGLFTLNSQIQMFSVYDQYLRIASKKFTNPINNNPGKRYHFEVVDKIPKDEDTTYVIKFYPLANARFESLKGVLFVEAKSWAVKNAILQPAIEKGFNLEVLQNCEKLQNGHFFPNETYTQFYINDVGREHLDLSIQIKSRINNVVTDTMFVPSQFDEYAIKYHSHVREDSLYWEENRSIDLSEKDRNTFIFYDSIGTLKQFERVLNFGERFYFKQIPYRKINVNLDKFIKINGYEYLRLGLGAETNERFHDHLKFGGYAGYGFNDKQIKYGVNTTYFLDEEDRSFVRLSYHDDLIESGSTDFYNDRSQYATEWLRKLSVRIMDKEKEISLHGSHSFARYYRTDVEVLHRNVNPQYLYEYDNRLQSFNFTELKLGLNITYGERYFRVLKERVSLGSQYPALWFQYTRGFSALGSHFTYNQFDFQIEQRIQILDAGNFSYQIQAGYKPATLPYGSLYSSKSGSAAVSHNSFETMQWNEFAANRHIDIFLSHDFGYFNYLQAINFRPRLELALNMGFGQLDNPDLHNFFDEDIQAQSYDRGFYEAGFLLNNLLKINYSGVKFGFGVGYYLRFGYYAYDTLLDNSVVKLTLHLGL